MVSLMGAFMNVAEMSKLMTSHCLMMDLKSNVFNDVGDGAAVKASTAGLMMTCEKPLATKRPLMMFLADLVCC